ncbi:MAG: small-conductance mechanosensitive channel MscS [Calditrichia bacterium]
MESMLLNIKELGMFYGLKVIFAILILIIGRIIAKLLKTTSGKVLKKGNVDPTLISFLSSLIYFGTLAFVIIAALGQLGVQTASLVAVLGAAGLAVGLALQGSLANFAAGVLIILFKPFRVGDYVEAGGAAGTVKKISIFTTDLQTPDNKITVIPNAKVTGDNITNYSAENKRRIDLVIGVSYQDDLDKVKKVIEDILSKDKSVIKEPAPTIGVLELADSSVNFAVRPWVNTADYWPSYFRLMETIKKRFDEENIAIPFPQLDVHMQK